MQKQRETSSKPGSGYHSDCITRRRFENFPIGNTIREDEAIRYSPTGDEKSMKYSQLVHMPRDVKQWLERQLEARGIDGVVYAKYLPSLLENNCTLPDFMPPGLDSKKKYLLENLLEELCSKLKEFENGDSSRLEFSPEYKSDTLAMDPTHGFSYGLTNGLNCMEPIQPCLPPNSGWTRGLLHDSSSETSKDKMEDYFSKLFYDNPTDVFGFDFAWNKSDERKNGKETDRVNFYNKQNLLATECSERLYERNADIDKLIAKFDARIEDIWKTTSDSDQLNMKYQSFLSQNFFPNPYLHHGSNLIWSFGEDENDVKRNQNPGDVTEGIPNYKSSFSHWNKFSSPLLTNSNRGFDAMLNSFNVTLSNMQKWSAIDNNTSNLLSNGKTGDLFVEVSPKDSASGLGNRAGLGYIAEGPQSSQEEEDLLTSAKTHFRPIRAEELGSSQTGVYADGTTFAISNDLEKVSFKRSESGTLYLEADADTPRKYMEFKEKENGWNKGDCESDGSSLEEFVPKFRVRQNNEKCCQTDELDEEQTVPSMQETDCESTSSESEEDEFYFPGDDELAQNIINAIEEEVRGESSRGNEEGDEAVDTTMEILEMSLYKMPEPKQCICSSGKEWNSGADAKKKHEWSEIWNSETMCDNCKNSEKLSTKDRFRFREELTREGEQLLLDLSCLQQMYSNSDWCDDDSTTESESNDDEGGNSVEEVRNEWEIGDAGKGFGWWSWLIAKDEPMKNNFDLSRFWKEEKSLTNLLENDKNKLNEKNERPLIADMIQKERKRRNSSSQKACNLYMEGQCRRPHCRFAHCDSAIPCPFFADASCMKGDSCPLSHGARRPISL